MLTKVEPIHLIVKYNSLYPYHGHLECQLMKCSYVLINGDPIEMFKELLFIKILKIGSPCDTL